MKENIEETREKLLEAQRPINEQLKKIKEEGCKRVPEGEELNLIEFMNPKSKETMTRLVTQIVRKLTEEEKKEIKDCVEDINKNPTSAKQSMIRIFEYWNKYIKTPKQSLSCNGCRKAVHKFWGQIIEECSKE